MALTGDWALMVERVREKAGLLEEEWMWHHGSLRRVGLWGQAGEVWT